MTNSSLDMKDHQGLTATSVIIICNQIVSLSIGLPLNCYVLFLLFTQGTGKDMDVTFTVSQSVSEILLSVIAPLSITCQVNTDLCAPKALGFFWGLSLTARFTFQCCVCLERYVAVVHPITFLRYKRRRYRLTCAVISWTVSLLYAVVSMVTFPQLPFITLAIMLSVLFSVDIFCFLFILKALRLGGASTMERERAEAGQSATKRKAFKIVCLNVLVFLLQSMPILCIFMLKQTFSMELFNKAVAICLSVNFAAGFVHPIFFLHNAEKLRLFRCL